MTRHPQQYVQYCRSPDCGVKGDKLIVASGLEGYIVADVDDALLIVPLEEEQKIKQYVNDMKSKFGDKYL